MEEIIGIEHLTKRFGDRCVYDDASASLFRGQIAGLVGWNGSGKSTLVKLLANLIFPQEGELRLFGKPVKSPEAFRKALFVFDSQNLYPDLTGFQNLEQAVSLYRRADRAEIDAALDRAGLFSSGNILIKRYSLGMKQRLTIAKLLLIRPELAVMDEPYIGMDREGIETLHETILTLNRENETAFLISSHQYEEIEKIVSDVWLVRNGKIWTDKCSDSFAETLSRLKGESPPEARQ